MLAILFATALTYSEALDKMRNIEETMTDCSLGVKHECQQLTTDIYEQDLNDLTIFQQGFRPESDAQLDEWQENLRNLQNASEDADAEIKRNAE
jgi:hypothetical protein